MATFKVQGGLNLKKPSSSRSLKCIYRYYVPVLLTPEEILYNIPDIRDVNILIDLLRDLNVKVKAKLVKTATLLNG